MRDDLLKLTATPSGPADIDYPKPERLLVGNPKRETWNRVQAPVADATVYCGVWRCEPGKWRIQMASAERELFTVISGRCRLHAVDGSFEEAGPGEAIYIAPGFEGAFEVLETLTKTYMIIE